MENQSLTDPAALSVLGVSVSAMCCFPHRTRPGWDPRSSPMPLCLLVSRGLIWIRVQNGLKLQNISGEANLDIVLYFRQVRGRPLSLKFWSCMCSCTPSRASEWGACSATPRMKCLGWVAEPLRVLKSAP